MFDSINFQTLKPLFIEEIASISGWFGAADKKTTEDDRLYGSRRSDFIADYWGNYDYIPYVKALLFDTIRSSSPIIWSYHSSSYQLS